VAGRARCRPGGGARCEGSGYRGRVGIFELMEMDSTLREMTFRKTPTNQIAEYARSGGGMTTLMQDGVRKILSGVTSVAEILRVTVKS